MSKWLVALAASFTMCIGVAFVTAFAPVAAVADNAITVSATVTLGDDLSMSYKVTPNGADFTNATATFTYKGVTTEATATTDEEQRYVYTFDGITPQNMNETLTLTVKDGEMTLVEKTSSVKSYCESLLASDEAAQVKTLAVDLLNYGAAAQEKTQYDVENLANKDVDEYQNLATPFEQPKNSLVVEKLDNQASSVKWYGARLVFNSYVGIEFACLIEQGTLGYTKLYAYEGETAVQGAQLEDTFALVQENAYTDDNGKVYDLYSVRVNNIKATQFNKLFTADVGNTEAALWGNAGAITYSVNSYIANKNDANENKLERTLYSYGKSAVAYKAYKTGVQLTGSLISAPTDTETGVWSGASYEGYSFGEEKTLPAFNSGAYTVSNVTQLSYTQAKATFTLKEDENISFEAEVDHVLTYGGASYTVYNLPDNATYADGTITLSLTDATVDNGIFVWNKSLTLNLAGTNTVTGKAYEETNPWNAGEVLPATVAVTGSDTALQITGGGTLNVNGNGGVRGNGNAVVNGATVNVNVAKRDDNNLYSDGFKLEGTLALANGATLVVNGVSGATSDKSGATFAALTLSGNSKLIVENFANGAYMNGGVVVENGSTLNVNNVTQYVLAGEQTVEIQSGATFTASLNAQVTKPIEHMHLFTVKKGAAVSVSTLDQNNQKVILVADANGARVTRENGTFSADRTINTFVNQNGTGETLSLYATYNDNQFNNDAWWAGDSPKTYGYYVYTNATEYKFLRFYLDLRNANGTFQSSIKTNGYITDSQISDDNQGGGINVVYNDGVSNITFTMHRGTTDNQYSWQYVLLGYDN